MHIYIHIHVYINLSTYTYVCVCTHAHNGILPPCPSKVPTVHVCVYTEEPQEGMAAELPLPTYLSILEIAQVSSSPWRQPREALFPSTGNGVRNPGHVVLERAFYDAVDGVPGPNQGKEFWFAQLGFGLVISPLTVTVEGSVLQGTLLPWPTPAAWSAAAGLQVSPGHLIGEH